MDQRQTFLLTGCAGGIGRHLTSSLLARGHCVYATDINLVGLAREGREHGWPVDRTLLRQLDVRDPAAWAEAVEEACKAFGELDVLVNIAGHMLAGWSHDTPAEEVDRHFDINAKGVIFGTQAAARRMIRQGHGQIINIASMAALAPIPGIALYAASKHAVRAFSLACAQELRPFGVHVTVICPDAVDTPLLVPQMNLDAAALVFSSPKLLSVEDLARCVINHALTRRPAEIVLPAYRGWLAKLTNCFPSLAFYLGPFFRNRGLHHQSQLKSALK
jgi:3-oxoacyl-[acyl-carrier protein] reductase